MSASTIHDVSDTAFGAAYFRAMEGEREDALFRDPLARLLAGEHGRRVAETLTGARFTAWAVAIRTHMIDAFLRERVAAGADGVLNLGAGLDTRPYRMELPAELRWIEVDHANVVAHKDKVLAREQPRCRLERVAVDLADRSARKAMLAEVGADAREMVVLAEGVVPYLSEEDAGALATDLRAQPACKWWVVDDYSPEVMSYMRGSRGPRDRQNAPMRCLPEDWSRFFASCGWRVRDVRWLGELSIRLGRPIPRPWIAALLRAVTAWRGSDPLERIAGFALLEPSNEPTEYGERGPRAIGTGRVS